MKINQKQYEKIAKYLPGQHGNVTMSNLQLANRNVLIYMVKIGMFKIGESIENLAIQIGADELY